MLNELKNKTEKIRLEIKQKIATYILAGFSFVAGLAWNEAIRGLIEKVFPVTSGGGLLAKFVYAIIITIIIVILSIYILKTDKDK